MRLRLTADLMELAMLYRNSAAAERRQAEDIRYTTREQTFIQGAFRKTKRAEKLEDLARKAEDFVLMPSKPFDGGPPFLLIVGGTDANDGSAFSSKRARDNCAFPSDIQRACRR